MTGSLYLVNLDHPLEDLGSSLMNPDHIGPLIIEICSRL